MRASEFLFEVEDTSTSNLIQVLQSERYRSDQIRLGSLIQKVRLQPGSEMFNVDLLIKAKDSDPTVGNLITKIEADETGVQYVFLKPLSTDDEDESADTPDAMGDTSSTMANPKKTVSTMAKRASAKRI